MMFIAGMIFGGLLMFVLLCFVAGGDDDESQSR